MAANLDGFSSGPTMPERWRQNAGEKRVVLFNRQEAPRDFVQSKRDVLTLAAFPPRRSVRWLRSFTPSRRPSDRDVLGVFEVHARRLPPVLGSAVMWTDRITFDPNQCGGRPCVRGLRIRVKDVLELLAAGVGEAEILEDFPYLEAADVRACLAHAAAEADHPVLVARRPVRFLVDAGSTAGPTSRPRCMWGPHPLGTPTLGKPVRLAHLGLA